MGMKNLLVGTLIAGFAAYGGNLVLFRLLGRRAATNAVPWWEEACKLAVVLRVPGASVWSVYGLFGILEFAYDVWRGQVRGALIGALALVCHAITAGTVAVMLTYSGRTWLAWAAAGLLHGLYNRAVLTIVLPLVDAVVMQRTSGT